MTKLINDDWMIDKGYMESSYIMLLFDQQSTLC